MVLLDWIGRRVDWFMIRMNASFEWIDESSLGWKRSLDGSKNESSVRIDDSEGSSRRIDELTFGKFLMN